MRFKNPIATSFFNLFKRMFLAFTLVGFGILIGSQFREPSFLSRLSTKLKQSIPTQKVSKPSSSLSDHWPTYHSPSLGYSIKFPTGWWATEGKIEDRLDRYLYSAFAVNPSDEIGLEVGVKLLENPSGKSAKDYVDEIISQFPYEYVNRVKRESILVDGVDAERVVGLPGRSPHLDVYVSCGLKIYELMLSTGFYYQGQRIGPDPTELPEEPVKLYEEMLRTLRFEKCPR